MDLKRIRATPCVRVPRTPRHAKAIRATGLTGSDLIRLDLTRSDQIRAWIVTEAIPNWNLLRPVFVGSPILTDTSSTWPRPEKKGRRIQRRRQLFWRGA